MSAQSSSAPAPAPPRRRSRFDIAAAVLLAAAVILLALSLAFPWWSESLVGPGSNPLTSTQDYSPISGVTGTCSPRCSPSTGGPPLGPFQGTMTFSSAGLNDTAALYGGVLGLGVIGMAGAALALVTSLTTSLRARLRTSALLVAIVASALGCGLLACLQPVAYRTDTAATFSEHGAWTVAPSPETSFWGSCSPGPSNGICASGWSVSWGPGLGWFMIAAAALALMAVALLPLLRARRSHAPAASTEKRVGVSDSAGASDEDVR